MSLLDDLNASLKELSARVDAIEDAVHKAKIASSAEALSGLEERIKGQIKEVTAKLKSLVAKTKDIPQEDSPTKEDLNQFHSELEKLNQKTDRTLVRVQAAIKDKIDALEKRLNQLTPSGLESVTPEFQKEVKEDIDTLKADFKSLKDSELGQKGSLLIQAQLREQMEGLLSEFEKLKTQMNKKSDSTQKEKGFSDQKVLDIETRLKKLEKVSTDFEQLSKIDLGEKFKKVEDQIAKLKESDKTKFTEFEQTRLAELESLKKQINSLTRKSEQVSGEVEERFKSVGVSYEERFKELKKESQSSLSSLEESIQKTLKGYDLNFSEWTKKIEDSIPSKLPEELETRVVEVEVRLRKLREKSKEMISEMLGHSDAKVSKLEESLSDLDRKFMIAFEEQQERIRSEYQIFEKNLKSNLNQEKEKIASVEEKVAEVKGELDRGFDQVQEKMDQKEALSNQLVEKKIASEAERYEELLGNAAKELQKETSDLQKQLHELKEQLNFSEIESYGDRFKSLSKALEESEAEHQRRLTESNEKLEGSLSAFDAKLEQVVEKAKSTQAEVKEALSSEMGQVEEKLMKEIQKVNASYENKADRGEVDNLLRKLTLIEEARVKEQGDFEELRGRVDVFKGNFAKVIEQRMKGIDRLIQETWALKASQLHEKSAAFEDKIAKLEESHEALQLRVTESIARADSILVESQESLEKLQEQFQEEWSSFKREIESQKENLNNDFNQKIQNLSLHLNEVIEESKAEIGKVLTEKISEEEEARLKAFTEERKHWNLQVEGLSSRIQTLSNDFSKQIEMTLETNVNSRLAELQKKSSEMQGFCEERLSEVENGFEETVETLKEKIRKVDNNANSLSGEYEKKLSLLSSDLEEKQAVLGTSFEEQLKTLESSFEGKSESEKQSLLKELNSVKNLIEKDKQVLTNELEVWKSSSSEKMENLKKNIEAKVESFEGRVEKIDEELGILQTDRLEKIRKDLQGMEEQFVLLDRRTSQVHDSLKFQFESSLQEEKKILQSKQESLKALLTSKVQKLELANEGFLEVQAVFEARLKSVESEKISVEDRLSAFDVRFKAWERESENQMHSKIREITLALDRTQKSFRELENGMDRVQDKITADWEMRFVEMEGVYERGVAALNLTMAGLTEEMGTYRRELDLRVSAWESKILDRVEGLQNEFSHGFRNLETRIADGEEKFSSSIQTWQQRFEKRFSELYNEMNEKREKETLERTVSQKENLLKFEEMNARLSELREQSRESIAAIESNLFAYKEDVSKRLQEVDEKVKNVETSLEKNIFERILSEEMWQNLSSRLGSSLDQFSVKTEKMVGAAEKRYWRKLSFRFMIQLFLISLLVLFSIAAIYLVVLTRAREDVKADLSNRFREEKVTETLLTTASEEVPKIIEEKATPVLLELEDRLTEEAESFEAFLAESKQKYMAQYQDFLNKFDDMKQLSELTRLEADVINNGDRNAYELLLAIAKGEDSETLAHAAKAALLRVKAFYSTSNRIENVKVQYEGPTGVRYENYSVPDEVLISFLREESDWKIRAKAARLLGTWKVYGVPDFLLTAARQDTHLDVVREALKSFEKITDYSSTDIFDVEAASEWWQSNKEAVDHRLRLNASYQGKLKPSLQLREVRPVY